MSEVRARWRPAGLVCVGLGLAGLLTGGLLALPSLGLGFLLVLFGGTEALADVPDVGPGLRLAAGGFWLAVAGVVCLLVSPWRDPKRRQEP